MERRALRSLENVWWRFKNEENGKMTCVFADGTRAEADAVVGCDGTKSACRPFVFGLNSELSRPGFTGKIAYRGMVS